MFQIETPGDKGNPHLGLFPENRTARVTLMTKYDGIFSQGDRNFNGG
jgi:hypothetical protein